MFSYPTILLILAANVATGQVFKATGTLNQARANHTATLLSNGTVLVVGGYGQSQTPLATAEIYDPVTGRWHLTTGTPNVARAVHAAVRLNDGRVLIVAGVTQTAQGMQATGSAEIFDPATESFTPTTPLTSTSGAGHAFNIGNNQVIFLQRAQTSNVEIFNYQARQWSLGASVPTGGGGPTMAQLSDGRILVSGGSEQNDVEVYTPATNSWQVLAPMATGRSSHTITPLPNGKVLIASGIRSGFAQNFSINNVEVYDPNALPNGATVLGPTITGPGPGGAGLASTLLPNGQVLTTGGGYTPCFGCAFMPLVDSTNYDFLANSLNSSSGPMKVSRTSHTMTLLPNGLVLIVGGRTDQFSAPTPVAELYGTGGFPSQPTSFVPTGSLSQPRISMQSTVLSNGMVLITGGTFIGESTTATAELYDPTSATFRLTLHPMTTPRVGHSASLLPDGRVLIAGGNNGQPSPNGQLSSTELFDPATETFTPGPPMTYSRDSHQALTLADGRIMIISGFGNGTTIPSYANNTVEIYNPSLSSWTLAAPIPTAPSCCYAATRLLDGRVFVSGGYSGGTAVSIYNPATNSWATKAQMLTSRASHGAATLPNGKVLIVGGNDLYAVQTANEIYDPFALPNGASQWAPGAFAGGASNALLRLPNGDVWVAGGASPRWSGASVCSDGKPSAQLFDYTTNTWTDLSPMLIGRHAYSAALLPSGKILVAGGLERDCPPTSFSSGGRNFLAEAELWTGAAPQTSGTILVSTNLAAATFTITGPNAYSGGGISYSVPAAPVGTYTIRYNDVAGYAKPPNETKTLTAGLAITFTGTYRALPSLTALPASLSFSYQQGVAGPIIPKTITLSSTGSPVSFTTSASTTPSGGTWLSVDPSSGTTQSLLTVTVAQGLSAGTYTGQITITSSGATNSPLTLPVDLTVSSNSTITITSVPSGAGFRLVGPSPSNANNILATTPYALTNAPVGDWTVTWSLLAGGFTTPPTETKTVSVGQPQSFVGIYTSKPIVVIVPGMGASTLTDSNQNDQWLSCSSILSLSNGVLSPLQYDQNGSPSVSLTPRELLTQSDTDTSTVKPSQQSVIQCNDTDLLAVISASGYAKALGATILCSNGTTVNHQCLQDLLITASKGGFLQFNAMLSQLTQNGYDTVAWPYDFRKDISTLADELYSRIQQIGSRNPGRRVAIITHSMGSIVAATMIHKYPSLLSSGSLANVITIAPPFKGSIDAYLDLQGWDSFAPFLSASNTRALAQNWTSAYQLLPQWRFVTPIFSPFPSPYDVFNGQNYSTPFPALPRASIVPSLADPSSVWSRIGSLGPLNLWYSIIGYGHRTRNQIFQSSDYSKPCFTIQEDDGDGTVPLQSAQGNAVAPLANRVFVNEKHALLPKNSSVIAGVLAILRGASPLTVPDLRSSPPGFALQDVVQVNACSPISVSVTDSSGNTINSQVFQIPDAKYANIGDATQISLPWNDTFQVRITGTGAGVFDLGVRGAGGQHLPLAYVFKSVPVMKGSQGNFVVGTNTTPTLQYDYSGRGLFDAIPANVAPPTVLCTGCYFIIQGIRATLAFNIGYLGRVSTFSFNYRNGSQIVQFASTTTGQVSVSGNTATFSGQGTLNGQPAYGFTVIAKDGGVVGSGLDTISVSLTGPNGYSFVGSGNVAGGDVIVK